MEALARFSRQVNRWFVGLAGVLAAAMLAVVTYDVAARNIFDAPTTWALDISRFLLLFVFFLSLAPALESGAHVSVDILEHYLAPPARRGLRIAARVLVLVFGAFLMWQVCEATYQAFVDDSLFPTSVPIKLKHVYWIGPLGVLQFLLTGVVLLRAAVRGRHAASANA